MLARLVTLIEKPRGSLVLDGVDAINPPASPSRECHYPPGAPIRIPGRRSGSCRAAGLI
jgi:hypothetical protein